VKGKSDIIKAVNTDYITNLKTIQYMTETDLLYCSKVGGQDITKNKWNEYFFIQQECFKGIVYPKMNQKYKNLIKNFTQI